MEEKKLQEKESRHEPQNSMLCSIGMTLVVSSVMLSTGMSVGSFNAALGSLEFFFNRTYQSRYNVTDTPKDVVTTLTAVSGSVMLLGGLLGSTCSGMVLTRMGRKSSAVLMNWINLVATVMISVVTFRVHSYECFICGRFIFGIFCGFGMNLIPMIVAESSTPQKQAFYLSLIGVNLSGGGLLGLCMGFEQVLGKKELAPLLLSLSFVPSVVYLLAAKWLPDSPYTLVRSGKRDQACACLKKLRVNISYAEVNATLDQIQDDQRMASQRKRVTAMEMYRNPAYFRILVACIVLYVQSQLCGINGVGMYTRIIFQAANFSESGSTTATAIVYTVQFLVAMIGSYGIDRYGPKRLNYVSSFVMAASLLALVVSMTLKTDGSKYASVVAVTIYVLSWACGVNLTLFPMLAAYSTDVTRETAFAIGGGVFWFFSWFVSFIFLYMLNALQQYTFLPFMLINFLFAVYVLLRMPETQGRTPKEVTDLIQGISHSQSSQEGSEMTKILSEPA